MIVPWITGVLVAIMGLVNLLSAVTPGLPSRLAWLNELYPVQIRHSAHLFTALSGFSLLILASGLLRRKRVAWILALGFLAVSLLLNLIKGFDYEESLFAAGLLLLLSSTRQFYTARSDRPSMAQGTKALLASILFTLVYGTAGFFLLDHAYKVRYDLPGAVQQTLLMFFSQDNSAGVIPRTRFAHFFVDSIYLVGGVTLLYSLLMLLRPILLRGEPATQQQRKQALSIAEAYGQSSLASFTLLKDKAYFFSPSGKSFIAYVPKGRGAVALGDPIGPREEAAVVIQGYIEFCKVNDWTPGFYQTQPELLELYDHLGFRAVKIGEDAIVDLTKFSTSGKAAQDLRSARNKLTKLGYRVEFHQPPLMPALLQELHGISDEWLGLMNGSEKRFSVGWFDDGYLRECQVAVVRSPEGAISAFANLISEHTLKEITIDMMRHRATMPHGTMDFLFLSLFQHCKEQGYERFNLGLSALSGVGEEAASARIERVLHYLFQHLNQFYNFKGLHAYKQKFGPRWEPRYLVFPGYGALMDVVVALIRADSGDRLIDYFKSDI